MFGQSCQLFGLKPFASPDITNTGQDSGLDKTVSDYVGRISYQPNQVYSFTARRRFDSSTFPVQRFEVESRANFDRWTFQALYGDYAPQPPLGFLTHAKASLSVQPSKRRRIGWCSAPSAMTSSRTRLTNRGLALKYVDDCLILSLNWLSGCTYTTRAPVRNNVHDAVQPAHAGCRLLIAGVVFVLNSAASLYD